MFNLHVFSYAQEEIQNNYSNEEISEYFKAAYNLARYDEALTLIKNIDESNYTDETYLLLGNIYLSKNDEKSAIAYYIKASELNKKYYKAYYNLGNLYFAKEDFLNAEKYYKKAVSYNSDFAPAHYNLGCVHLKLKKYYRAKGNFIRAISLNPKNVDYSYNLAYTYKMLRKDKTAQKILSSINKTNKVKTSK